LLQAEVLATYIEQHPDVVNGKQVIELGAGSGLVGMVAALLGTYHLFVIYLEMLNTYTH